MTPMYEWLGFPNNRTLIITVLRHPIQAIAAWKILQAEADYKWETYMAIQLLKERGYKVTKEE